MKVKVFHSTIVKMYFVIFKHLYWIILARKIPWTKELGGLQSTGLAKSQTWISDWALLEYNNVSRIFTDSVAVQHFPRAVINSRSVQFSSVAQSCPTLCDPTDGRTPSLPVHHQLVEFTQTHVHWVGDAIQSSHPLSSPSPPTFNRSQHQSLFQRVISSHQVAKILDSQLQHQSFQWIVRTDFL